MKMKTPLSDPVCFAHMLVDGHVIDSQTWKDVSTFRKSERKRLYAARQQVSACARKAMSAQISERLIELLGDVGGRTVAVYWPIRGEINLRPFMLEASRLGARICLPVVIEKDQPVEFHHWTPDSAMAKGIWNIPVLKQMPWLYSPTWLSCRCLELTRMATGSAMAAAIMTGRWRGCPMTC